jgi:thiol-disulfide isomerase/thioredoxin
MSKTIVIIGVVAFFLVGGGIFFMNQNSQQGENLAMEREENTMEQDGNSMMMKDDSSEGSGQDAMPSYVEYSKAALDQASSNRRVLYFYASWCPTCRPADADLSANMMKIPSDVTVIRVNYNDSDTDQEEKDLAKQYGISYQHTFVQIDKQGMQVVKWNGGQTDELLANLK